METKLVSLLNQFVNMYPPQEIFILKFHPQNNRNHLQCRYPHREIRQFFQLQAEGQSLIRSAMRQLNLSARAYHRILKLSCMIADLAGSEEIQSAHLAEALQYRPKIMMGV